MIAGTETNRENLTLTEADLVACRPIVSEDGHVLRAFCPFHGSDRQRSLRVQVQSGRFVCFACGAWGYMDTARAQWREEQQHHVRPLQGGLTWPSSLPRSRLPCRAVVAQPTCSSAAFPSPWRSSAAWAMRRPALGRTLPATGAAAAWSFRIPHWTGAS